MACAEVVKLWLEVIIRLIVACDPPVTMSKYEGKWMNLVQNIRVENFLGNSAPLN